MLKRKQVGAAEMYLGRSLTALYVGPDLIAFVDKIELSGFYINRESALIAGRKHVDAEIKAKESK